MTRRKLPSNASVATPEAGGKLVAPAASRNSGVLCDLLLQWAPRSGSALEIASGTGQHVSAFATVLPEVNWQPTEVDHVRRASIDAYKTALANVSKAAHLDATTEGWHKQFAELDLVVLINLLHLISWDETKTLLTEVARALCVNGRFVLYGPFKRSGTLTSDGDQRFHDALFQQDPEIGYKNDDDIAELMEVQGLSVVERVELPANNLAFIADKRGN